MTWLGIVAIVSFSSAIAGLGVLACLAISLKAEGAETERQVWNRRMLVLGASLYLGAILFPFVSVSASVAGHRGLAVHGSIIWSTVLFAIPVIALGILIGGMIALRHLGRVVVTVIYLSVGIVPAIIGPVHRGTYFVSGIFVVVGLSFAKLTRLAMRRSERQKRHSELGGANG